MSGKPSNILFLLADQFRHDALGATGGGFVKTPHLDRLAREGACYTNAYTPLPVCAPARQALLTGRHPDSHGAYWNYNFFATPPLLPQGESWPEQLSQRGSFGGYVGKWNASPAVGPAEFGFQAVADASAHGALLREKYPGLAFTGGWMGCESPVALEDSKTHFLARQALDTIRQADGRPWHVWLDFGMPHLPCQPSAPFSALYNPADIPPWPGFDDPFRHKPFCHRQQMWNWRLENITWPEMANQVARYYGMVSQIDDAIGGLLDALQAESRLEDTLVVFTSDHGDMCGNHRMFDKHYVLYDDIVRVPLLLWGAGVRQGACDALVSNCLDLPPTLSSLFGLAQPAGAHGRPLPGYGEARAREWITSSSSGQQFGMYNTRMITNGRIKYVWNLTDIDELYDIKADPGELHNRIDDPAFAETLPRLRRLLYDDLLSHGDPFVRGDWVVPQLLEGRKCR